MVDIPPKYSDSPHNKAKKIVSDHHFEEVKTNFAAGTWYTTPNDTAMAMVDSYYQNPHPGATPKSIAVAAIYNARLLFNIKKTQTELADQYDIMARTMGLHSDHLLERISMDLNPDYEFHE